MVEQIVVAVVSSAVTVAVLCALGKVRLGTARDDGRPARQVAMLEVQLARARTIPGAEPLLERLATRPVIGAPELTEFTRQLDHLARKALVEETRKQVASERRAPMVARAARQAVASLEQARRERLVAGEPSSNQEPTSAEAPAAG